MIPIHNQVPQVIQRLENVGQYDKCQVQLTFEVDVADPRSVAVEPTFLVYHQ